MKKMNMMESYFHALRIIKDPEAELLLRLVPYGSIIMPEMSIGLEQK